MSGVDNGRRVVITPGVNDGSPRPAHGSVFIMSFIFHVVNARNNSGEVPR